VKRAIAAALIVVAGLALPVGVIAAWAQKTLFDSATFSDRTTAMLRSSAVRNKLAERMTQELARGGNQQAVDFGPGLQLAIQAAIDTDTFRSIFRTAVRQTHQSVLAGQSEGGKGLNLADSVSIIASTVQLSGAQQKASSGQLDNSLTDVTEQLGRLGVWKLEDTISTIGLVALVVALAAGAGAIALSDTRSRTIRQLGWTLVIDGLVIVALLQALQFWASRRVDPDISNAVSAAISEGTADLRAVGFWIAAYGLIVVAAVRSTVRYTPKVVYDKLAAWIERRRRTTGGTVLLGLLALFIGLVFIQEPLGNLRLLIIGGGLWLTYLGVSELFSVIRSAVPARDPGVRWKRLAIEATAVVALVAIATTALVVTSTRAAHRANAAGESTCNGSAELCDLRLDQVMFPGTHNSMSASLSPGFFFAEQINTIKEQLGAGVRALLIDSHYGIESKARLPGTSRNLVVTDRAAELATPSDDRANPTLDERAAVLSARAPKAARAKRAIYLCHNYCELGSYPFRSGLRDIKSFADSHPTDVVMVILEDHTTPADTVAAIQASGLVPRLATLTPGKPLPTLRDLINKRQNVLLFAEAGAASGVPPWYMQAYRWFQESPFDFSSAKQFNCRPNRGSPRNPLMLLNHWITGNSLPDPNVAAKVNSATELERRIQACIAQRGILPTIVAVNFAEKGDLLSTVKDIDLARAGTIPRRNEDDGQTAPTSTTTTAPPPTVAVGPQTPVPATTNITSLTGGDPARFCKALVPTLETLAGWSYAVLGDNARQTGTTDLVYGPILQRDMKQYVSAAPLELADRARPILQRAQHAVAALKALGIDDATIRVLADRGSAELHSSTSPDGLTVQQHLTSYLQTKLSAARLADAAIVFAAGEKDPESLLDLGSVSKSTRGSERFHCSASLGNA
jgi:hypothetical protein